MLNWKRLLPVMLLIIVTVVTLLPAPAQPVDAQRPDAPDYALRGDFTVGTRELTIEDDDRPLEVTIWYPAVNPDNEPVETEYRYSIVRTIGQALRDAAPDLENGPYPLIVFSHGSGGFRYQSLFYTEHLASWGFVVLSADHPGNTLMDMTASSEQLTRNFALRPVDVLRQIDLADSLNESGDLAGLFDMDTIGVTGHSFGGYTALATGGARLDFNLLEQECTDEAGEFAELLCQALNEVENIATLQGLESVPDDLFFPAPTDDRIQAIVPLAPYTPFLFSDAGLNAVQVPVMIIVGGGDTVTPPAANSLRPFRNVGSDTRALVVLENADHYIFIEECNEVAINAGFYEACSDKVWDMARAHDLTNHFATAFFLAVLQGDENARAAIAPEAVEFPGVNYEFVSE